MAQCTPLLNTFLRSVSRITQLFYCGSSHSTLVSKAHYIRFNQPRKNKIVKTKTSIICTRQDKKLQFAETVIFPQLNCQLITVPIFKLQSRLGNNEIAVNTNSQWPHGIVFRNYSIMFEALHQEKKVVE